MSPVSSGSTTGGAQVSMSEYINLIRDELEDWDNEDELQAAMAVGDTSFTARNGALFEANTLVEIGEETVRVSGPPTGNVVPCYRHQRGTQATTHPNGTRILVKPVWTDKIIRRKANESFAKMYPRLYTREVTTLTGSSTSYDYTLPTDLTQPHQVETVTLVVDTVRKPIYAVTLFGDPMQMRIEFPLSGYSIEVAYTKPFPKLDTLEAKTTIPEEAEELPVFWACYKLISQKENKRSRSDSYQVIQDERGTPLGGQLNVGASYREKFDELLSDVKMSPPGRLR